MSKTYHYRINSQVFGAITYEEMVQLVKNGVLEPETQVSHDSQQTWFDAGHVGGLFHMAGRADEVSQWRARQRATTPAIINFESATDSEPLLRSENHSVSPETPETVIDVNETSASLLKPTGTDQKATESKNVPTADNEDWEHSGNLSREIKQATYAAALDWQSRHQGKEPEPVVVRDTPIRNGIFAVTDKLRKATLAVILFPFSVFGFLWSYTGIKVSIPNWVFHLFDRFISASVVIACFRWVATLAVPNLIAWGVHSWSLVEAQRYPVRGEEQPIIWSLPIWGQCSSSGEYYFLLIDIMIVAAIATYMSIRWLELQADDA